MAVTNHIGITLVEQSQSQKEVTVNQALTRIDALLNTGAKSRTTNTPPGSPLSGDLYIVGASPTGVWVGQAGKITYYDQIWRFITPNEGLTLWVNDENLVYIYDGTAWNAVAIGEVNTASNLGSGTGVYSTKVGADLRFKSLIAGSNITLSNTSNDITIASSLAALTYNTQSGTSYTLLSSDAGKVIYFTSASAVTFTLPNNLSIGFTCRVIQAGAGQVTFSPAAGANRRNRQSHTKTAGQWAECWLQVVTNSGGTSAEYVLAGDTAV